MATFLLAWNPGLYPWGSLRNELRSGGRDTNASFSWSVGRSRKPRPQDRAFMIRLGVDPKGIVASGWVTSEPFEGEHWNRDRARTGGRSFYVGLALEYVSEAPVIPWERLHRAPLSEFNWGIQMSGLTIPEPIAQALEREWSRRVSAVKSAPDRAPKEYFEGRRYGTSLTRIERNPSARAVCIAHHGRACSCCGMRFEKRYGKEARNLIVVHHLKPIAYSSGRQRVDPIRDLRPVCPNCHAVLHLRNPPYSIEEVKALARRRRSTSQ